MPEAELQLEISRLQQQIKQLNEQNELLLERTEDILLLGFISDKILAATTRQEVFSAALESIATLKDIPFVALLSVKDSRAIILDEYPPGEKISRCGTVLELKSAEAIVDCVSGFADSPHFLSLQRVPLGSTPVQFAICPIICRTETIWLYSEGSFTATSHLHSAIPVMQRICDMLRARINDLSMNEELASLNKSLSAANQDITSFSYSVSHDLRAPLRHIAAYNQILFEDYGEIIGQKGRDYIERIRRACSNTSELIDGLINLSSLYNVSLQQKSLSLSHLAHEVITELRENEPGREINSSITDGINVNGDPVLLKSVMMNLLGNAWKYTMSAASPSIEFGQINQSGRKVYFVRDNGIGFDMNYADKLFEVFQRLHSDPRFTGHGIGLATVQRIILKHGGSIWAEAEPDKGATFFFTIP